MHRKATGAAPANANVVLGQGRALDGAVQRDMESRFGTRFDDVRIHDDGAAAAAADTLHAHAFTRGHDVAFAAGKYAPTTPEGRELLAHELTHVLQNRSGHTATARVSSPGDPAEREAEATAARIVAGRSGPEVAARPSATLHRSAAGASPEAARDSKVEIFAAGAGKYKRPTIVFEHINVAKTGMAEIKKAYGDRLPLVRSADFRRETDKGKDPNQISVWAKAVKPGVKAKLETVDKKALPIDGKVERFAFQHQKSSAFYFGTLDQVADQVAVPKWDHEGNAHTFDVDHIIELQLADWNTSGQGWANLPANMWLLDSSANRSSGSTIAKEINEHASSAIPKVIAVNKDHGSVEAIKKNYDLHFKEARGSEKDKAYYFAGQIDKDTKPDALGHLKPADIPGESADLRIFGRRFGGISIPIAAKGQHAGSARVENAANTHRLSPLELKDVRELETVDVKKDLAKLVLGVPKDHPALRGKEGAVGGDIEIPVRRVGDYRRMGFVEESHLSRSIRELAKAKHSSPLVPDDVDFGPRGFYSRGKLVTDLPVWKGADIDFLLDGDRLRVEKRFEIGDIKVPKPFRVSGASMTLSIGTDGVGAEGAADFAIDKVGQGSVMARIDSATGLELGGHFALDKALFAGEAKIAAHYARGAWSVEGDLAIPAGKIPGVKSGTVHVGYADEKLSASGSAELSIPGVKKAELALELSEKEGLTLAGRVDLADGLPGIKRGFLGVRVHRPAAGGYQLSARGEAEAGVAGIGGKLAITYEDGAFDAFVRSAFEKGRLRGFIGVGVTNRVIDKDGKPVPGKPSDKLSAYGGGSLNVRFSKWLEGTVGAKIGQQGDLELSGRVALPASIPVFEPYILQKEFGHLGVTVPIFGPIVAGVSGGFTARATVGPGTLEDAHLDVTYNPAHEEQAKIGGGARFHVPAFVGVGFFVRGGIGLSVLVAKVQGFVEANAEFGLAGAADASVAVSWSPSTGVSLDAAASIKAEAALKAGLALGYEASALLWSHTKSYQLKSYDLGTKLSFGVHFPIQYRDGKPFAIALDAVRIDHPDIKATEIIPKLVKAARGGSEEV